MASLPFEILCRIIDVANSSRRNEIELSESIAQLQAFSLTCRALSPHCQQHLFSRVNLHFKDYSEDPTVHRKAYNFARIINDSPHIAHYVRKLKIFLVDGNIEELTSDNVLFVDILSALGKIDYLEELEVVSVWEISATALLQHILLGPCFVHLLSRPSLRRLKIQGLKDMSTSFLDHSPAIQYLHIFDTAFNQDLDAQIISCVKQPMRLKGLEVMVQGGPHSSLRGFLTSKTVNGQQVFDMASLKTLCIDDYEVAKEVLSCTSDTIQVEKVEVSKLCECILCVLLRY